MECDHRFWRFIRDWKDITCQRYGPSNNRPTDDKINLRWSAIAPKSFVIS